MELDTAVLTAGAGGDVAEEVARLGASVPTQPQRRVQQSISLAQRLLKVCAIAVRSACPFVLLTSAAVRPATAVPGRGGVTEAGACECRGGAQQCETHSRGTIPPPPAPICL